MAEQNLIVFVVVSCCLAYKLLRDEIELYGTKATTQKAHMSSAWMPVWGLVYVLAAPVAVVWRIIHGRR